MIRLRTKPPVPDTLKSDDVKKTKKKIAAKVASKTTITEKDFENHWIKDDVRLVLWKYQHGKCCFCERKRDPKGESDIEHFRPKTKADGVKPGYWWLAYDWDNLFFSCKRCNKKKASKFPLLSGLRARSPKSKVKEKPVFPHPVDDNPEDFIGFIWEEETARVPIAWPVGKDNDGCGSETIKILGLDNRILAEERGRLLLSLGALAGKMNAAKYLLENEMQFKKGEVDEVKKEIKKETKADFEYAGFRRAFFRLNRLGEYVSND